MKFLTAVILMSLTFQPAFSQVKFKEVKTAKDVIYNNILALGGEDKIKNIKSETLTGNLQAGGMEIGFFVFRNDTMNFVKAEGMAHGSNMLLLKSLTTMTFGWEYQMTGLKDYQGDELLKKQLDMITGNINFPLTYEKKGFTFKLTGIDTLNGKQNYKLELLKDGSVIRTYYFDHDTFLLTEFRKPEEVVIEYSDYRDINGIYRPFKINQKGQMDLTFSFENYDFNKTINDSLLSKPSDN